MNEMLSAYLPQSRSQEVIYIIMNTLVKKINYYWKRLYEKSVILDMSIGNNTLEETDWICFLLYCF